MNIVYPIHCVTSIPPISHAGLLGLPESPEKGKKRPFLARIGKSKNYL
jgi:hypothetical protein